MGLWRVVKAGYRLTKGAAHLTGQGLGAATKGLEQLSESMEAYATRLEKAQPFREIRHAARMNLIALDVDSMYLKDDVEEAIPLLEKAVSYNEQMKSLASELLDDEALTEIALANSSIMKFLLELSYSDRGGTSSGSTDIRNNTSKYLTSTISAEDFDMLFPEDKNNKRFEEFQNNLADFEEKMRVARIDRINRALSFVPFDFNFTSKLDRVRFLEYLDVRLAELERVKSTLIQEKSQVR
ncbi:hypothetical protein [Aliidiomarina indica]|uniref:hypothetical protein n=1 Tax=Aliidiomarina indica TaxID=2749147 RepID=UPI00188E33A9|nr:hypothetical protein [Aliidiomarina indica]